jgi:hypothetical protein
MSCYWLLSSERSNEMHMDSLIFQHTTSHVDVGLVVVTSCGLVGRYWCFGGIYCLHRQVLEAVCFSETLVSTLKFTWGYNHKTNTDIFTAVRTWNLTQLTCWRALCPVSILCPGEVSGPRFHRSLLRPTAADSHSTPVTTECDTVMHDK